ARWGRAALAAALAGALGRRHRLRRLDPRRAARAPHDVRRALKWVASVVVTGLAIAYLVWKIDIGRTGHILPNAKVGYFLASLALMIGSVWPMAWRWQRLLAARGIREGVPWLTRAYFVGYMVAQVLPTAIGGDASRIFETSRRHPGEAGPVAGTVLLERALG